MERLMRTAAVLAMEYRQPRLAVSMPRLFPPNIGQLIGQALLPSKFLKRQIASAPTLIRRHGAWMLRFTRRGSQEGPNYVRGIDKRAGAGAKKPPVWRAVDASGRPDAPGRVRASRSQLSGSLDAAGSPVCWAAPPARWGRGASWPSSRHYS